MLHVLPVNVMPAAIHFLEAAVFVKTMAFAVNLEAGNKLNTAGVVVRATCCRRGIGCHGLSLVHSFRQR